MKSFANAVLASYSITM